MRTRILWAVGIALVVYLAVTRQVLTVYTGIDILAAIVAIVLHEVAHGLAALYYGDRTAASRGRLSLNPLAHIDPFGTIILPGLLLLLHLVPIGYAKPVPIDPSRMRNRRRAELVVSLAGPATNLALSIVSGLVLRLLLFSSLTGAQSPVYGSVSTPASLFDLFWIYLGVINAILCIFNLIPIPPLDGSAILRRIIGERRFFNVAANMRFILPIVLIAIFVFPGILGHILNPVINLWLSVFLPHVVSL